MANGGGNPDPDHELRERFQMLLDRQAEIRSGLLEKLPAVVIDLLREGLPGTIAVEIHGEVNEDWLTIARVERVLGRGGTLLFDAAAGHPDRHVEDLVDEVGSELLDILVDLAPDTYLGRHTLRADSG
jgi:hypothetical protein